MSANRKWCMNEDRGGASAGEVVSVGIYTFEIYLYIIIIIYSWLQSQFPKNSGGIWRPLLVQGEMRLLECFVAVLQ